MSKTSHRVVLNICSCLFVFFTVEERNGCFFNSCFIIGRIIVKNFYRVVLNICSCLFVFFTVKERNGCFFNSRFIIGRNIVSAPHFGSISTNCKNYKLIFVEFTCSLGLYINLELSKIDTIKEIDNFTVSILSPRNDSCISKGISELFLNYRFEIFTIVRLRVFKICLIGNIFLA